MRRGLLRALALLGLTALALTACSSGTPQATSSGRAPGAPAFVSLSADGSTLVVQWGAPPTDSGAAAVTGYRLSVNGLSTATLPADTTRFEVPDVEAGKSLTVAVAASSSAGDGPAATSQLVMPSESASASASPTGSPTSAAAPTSSSASPTTSTASPSPTSASPSPSPTSSGAGAGSGGQPTTNPAAFVPPTVVSTSFLGCTALPTSPVTHHWQVEVVTRGGQNWTPVDGTVHGTGLVIEADTNRSRLLMAYLTVTDPGGASHRVPFPPGEVIDVAFATACP